MEMRNLWLALLALPGIAVLFLLLLRIIVVVVCRVLHKKYGIKVDVQKFSFFSVQGISVVLKNGTILQIEKLWLRCSFFNKTSSLFVICVNDIRLQGDAFWLQSSGPKPSNGKSKIPMQFPFRGLKFFSLKAYNLSVMQLGKPKEFLLHISLKELNIFFEDSLYGVSLNSIVTETSLKIFKHLPSDPEKEISDSCLGHLSANVHLQLKVCFNQKDLVQCFSLCVTQPELILYEGFSMSRLKRQVSSPKRPIDALDNGESNDFAQIPESQKPVMVSQNGLSWLKKFPENSSFKLDFFSIKLMKESGNKTITMGIKSVDAHLSRNDELNDLSLLSLTSSFCIRDVVASSSHDQFAQLESCSFKLDVGNKLVSTTAQLSSFIFSYDKDIFQSWLDVSAFNSKKSVNVPNERASSPKKLLNPLEVFQGFHLRNTTEFDNIYVSAKFPGCSAFSAGLMHCRFMAANSCTCLGKADVDAEILFEIDQISNDFSFDLLVEVAYLRIGNEILSDGSALKKLHYWNIPVSVGMVLLKVKKQQDDHTIECMADNMQFEWSPVLVEILCDLRKYSKAQSVHNEDSYVNNELENVISSKRTSSSYLESLKKNLSVIVNFAGVNVFVLSEMKKTVLLRTDSVNFDFRSMRIKTSCLGLKVSVLPFSSSPYSCLKSSEIKSFVLNVVQTRILHDLNTKETSIELSEDICSDWNTNFHILVMTVIEDFQIFCKEILSKKQTSYDEESINQKEHKKVHISVVLRGNINIGLQLSSAHRVEFLSSNVTATFSENMKSTHADVLIAAFDNHKIFNFKNFIITLAPGSEQQLYIRKNFENLERPNNRLLNVHMDDFKLIFPYQYNFAEAFSEEFIGITKWLKQKHKMKKVPFTLDSPLPPDLLIKTKAWTVILEDDPFEVKLRDNFQLFEDEYHESLERRSVLEEKIEGLRKTHTLLASEKIEQLHFNLTKKCAEIYIQRSQRLYQNEPMRTSLFTYHLEDIEILAIADTSYHGAERVVSHMRLIDPESPFPEEGIEFNTLWARKIRCSTSSWTCTLRDFSQPLLMIKGLYVWGFLIGAEQEGPPRAKRTTVIELGDPWGSASVERNMPALKYYHDLTFDMEEFSMSYGPCWEPIMAQHGLSMDYVSRPSLDPSPPLAWWDKMRLIYHGRLTLSMQHLSLFMRASLDPYNNTEQMELTWSDVIIEWTTGKILTRGDLDVYVHTASKYDDCRVLRLPNLKLSVNMDWLCLGNPFDHHSAIPCAPDKIPEYSMNQEHDSYRAFRSQNLNISYSFETKNAATSDPEDLPSMLLYSSTLRWIENLKMILSGLTRLTRRGKLFDNTKPRKPQLSRHYRNVRLSFNLQRFQIFYWMSFAKRQGLELFGGRLALSCENTLSLVPLNDVVKRRPRACWSIAYFNCELCDSEMWLYNWEQSSDKSTAESFSAPVQKSYFLSVNRVSYGREEIVKDVVSDEDKPDTPTHKLVVHGLKGAWTKHNRTVVFSLYDSYIKNLSLKKNLSTDALRGFKVETQNTPQKHRSTSANTSTTATPSPVTHLQSGHAISMLQKLISEAEANPMVFTEELESSTREQLLHGVAACQTDDVLQKKWLIELVNSQVMLKGIETSGYVIVSAAKAQILQRIHRPVWKDSRSLVSKTTWVGSFECMQYYATVDAGEPGGGSLDNVMWLTVDNIDGRNYMIISDLADMVGSGHSVGGVISKTVGAASDSGSGPIQLQRIVSRCGCQFFLASYGENEDPSTLEVVPPLIEELDLWEREVAVDSFTLTHHDLEMCTNSLQYAMILDLVNNLLLYVEPRKKEAFEKLQCMRFQLQLRSVDDQKEPILQLQQKLRALVATLRRLEKEAYVTHKIICEYPEKSEEYIAKLQRLENSLYNCKEKANSMNEELTIMICCYKETQIIANRSRQRTTSQEKGTSVARRAEVCFKHAQWRLTDPDGQLGIADIVLSNFLYSKVTKVDDSVAHLLELGYIKVTNLLPNQVYKQVLEPSDFTTSIPMDRQCMLRIYCREKAPVGGISVKEHLELNVIPLTIGLTEAFYKAMLKFFFPGRDTDKDEHQDEQSSSLKKKDVIHRGSSTFYRMSQDIEKMKERAEKNHTFFYVKIPEVPLRVSYQGKKEKNIEDVRNLNLVLSTLEYHNKTWTWLDLLMELKNDAKKILLSQAIRQKIIKPKVMTPRKDNEPPEEEKASILLGTRNWNAPERSSKRKMFSLKREPT